MSESNFIQNCFQSTEKFCHRCKTSKPKTEFYKDKTRADGLYSYCRICTKAHVRKWEIENKEKHAANSRKWRENNKEKRAEIVAKWVQNNKKQHLLACKNWRVNNKHKACAYSSKRRLITLKAIPKWANIKKIEEIYKKAQEMRLQGLDVHVDHIIPLINKNVCGLHVEQNLRIINAKENLKKANKLIFD